MAGWALPAVMAGGELVKYFTGLANQPKAFANTAYGKYLTKLKNEGAMPSAVRSGMLSQVGARTAESARSAGASTAGSMYRRGLEGSIAGTAAVTRAKRGETDKMYDAALELAIQNERSKVAAEREIKMGKMERSDQKDAYKRSLNTQLIGGLTDVATAAAAGIIKSKEATAATAASATEAKEGIAAIAKKHDAKITSDGDKLDLDAIKKLVENLDPNSLDAVNLEKWLKDILAGME